MNSDSKYFDEFSDHVLDKKPATGAKGIVFDIIHSLTGLSNFENVYRRMDGGVQDALVECWIAIVERH